MSELGQFWVCFAVFVFLTFMALITSRDYREAYLDWLTFKDPFGQRLLRDFTIRHLGPMLLAVLLAIILLTCFPARS